MTTDLLYLTHNRLAYSQFTWQTALQNTDWGLVRKLWWYDDASTDGTAEWGREAIQQCPVGYEFVAHHSRSPVQVMNLYMDNNPADAFAQLGNDICAPPGWLGALGGVLDRHPGLQFLGMEPGRVAQRGPDEPFYSWAPCDNIGGVGLMRTAAFTRPIRANGVHGFSEYQWQLDMVRGWISPDLPAVSLDSVPREPWMSLSREYHERGWQRHWGFYREHMSWCWEWLGGVRMPAEWWAGLPQGGECPECGERVGLKRDGTLRKHGDCSGWGELPAIPVLQAA